MLNFFFFNLFNLVSNWSFYLLLSILVATCYLLFSDLRKKFLMFLFVVVVYSIWGFLLDLDGIFLVFITAELTVFLLLLMTYLQLYGTYSFLKKSTKLSHTLTIALLVLSLNQQSWTFYPFVSFYKNVNHIVSSDFFILYYILFEKLPILVVLLTLVISFFSLFFIFMYFSLKLVKAISSKKTKNLYFIRKQVLSRQTRFLSKTYTFQN